MVNNTEWRARITTTPIVCALRKEPERNEASRAYKTTMTLAGAGRLGNRRRATNEERNVKRVK